jgi:hypothetical protein
MPAAPGATRIPSEHVGAGVHDGCSLRRGTPCTSNRAAARAQALAAAARLELNLNRLDIAGTFAAGALELYRELADAYGVTEVHDTQAVIEAHSGRIRQALPLLAEVARRYEDEGRLLRVGMPRTSHCHMLILMARPAEGLTRIEEAVELKRTLAHAPNGYA